MEHGVALHMLLPPVTRLRVHNRHSLKVAPASRRSSCPTRVTREGLRTRVQNLVLSALLTTLPLTLRPSAPRIPSGHGSEAISPVLQCLSPSGSSRDGAEAGRTALSEATKKTRNETRCSPTDLRCCV